LLSCVDRSGADRCTAHPASSPELWRRRSWAACARQDLPNPDSNSFIPDRRLTVRTFSPKAADVERQWYVIDATGVVLGRLASQIATLLRGKHKPIYAPHVDTGDFVIVVNADKVVLTGKKLDQKKAYRLSGYPGGLRSV